MSKTAYVNLNTGKIYNCKKGSWAWYHEKAHLVYDRNENMGRLKLYQQYIFEFWMLSVILSILSKFALPTTILLFTAYIFISFYEEKWCNDYANKRFKYKGDY